MWMSWEEYDLGSGDSEAEALPEGADTRKLFAVDTPGAGAARNL